MQIIITGEYDEIVDFMGLNTSSEDVTTREELIEELVKLEYKIKNDLSKHEKKKIKLYA